MKLVPPVSLEDKAALRRYLQKLASKLGPEADPTFAGLTLTDLTASALVGTNASKLLESVTIGDSLDYTRPTLDTIQDIRTSASPTFAGLTVTNACLLGSNSAVFQPNADSTTFFQVLDADGGTPILSIDTTNERVGIGTATPSQLLQVGTTLYVNNATKRLAIGKATNDKFNTLEIISPGTNSLGSGVFQVAMQSSGGDTTAAGFTIWNPSVTNSFFTFAFCGNNMAGFRLGIADVRNGVLIYNNDAPSDAAAFLAMGTSNSAPLYFSTDAIVRVTVAAAGNIGFGGETAPETLTEWTHAQPYLTLHNSTHEDSDGGRESRLNFKGEQTGGEETTLARIEVGHDGSSDDEKGYIDGYTNTGSDGNSPTKCFRFDANGTFSTLFGRILKTNRLTGNTTLDATHHQVFADTDGGAFTVTLPAGVAGTEYRIINTGSSENNLTIAPDGAELLIGVNANWTLMDGEALMIVYEATEGWF